MKTLEYKWQSPSNIALIKYWGKREGQLPCNPSISFTLDQAQTQTSLVVDFGKTERPFELNFLFEGLENASFANKIIKKLEGLGEVLPMLKTGISLTVNSSNTFPHSAGIASSASSMSALALCLLEAQYALDGNEATTSNLFGQEASSLARLLSGSACRSLFPVLGQWGKAPDLAGSSDEWAIGVEAHPVFSTYRNDILIVSRKEKTVSSTAGHNLMTNHPFANARYQQACTNLQTILPALKTGDVEVVGDIMELEALVLHGLMMSSTPSFILLEPNSLNLINEIRQYRAESGLPLYFSIDAGPNIHLLYPAEIESRLADFIETRLKPFCVNGQIIKDKIGMGASRI
jgi:diphosphomevalonate decarboxylase